MQPPFPASRHRCTRHPCRLSPEQSPFPVARPESSRHPRPFVPRAAAIPSRWFPEQPPSPPLVTGAAAIPAARHRCSACLGPRSAGRLLPLGPSPASGSPPSVRPSSEARIPASPVGREPPSLGNAGPVGDAQGLGAPGGTPEGGELGAAQGGARGRVARGGGGGGGERGGAGAGCCGATALRPDRGADGGSILTPPPPPPPRSRPRPSAVSPLP